MEIQFVKNGRYPNYSLKYIGYNNRSVARRGNNTFFLVR